MTFRLDPFSIEGFSGSAVAVDDQAVTTADAPFLTQICPEPGVKECCFGSEAATESGVDFGVMSRQWHFTNCRNTTCGADNSDRGGAFDGIDLHAIPERFLDFFQESDKCRALLG